MAWPLSAKEAVYNVDSLSLDGGADPKGGRIVITANLGDPAGKPEEKQLIYAADVQSTVQVASKEIVQTTQLIASVKHGTLEEIDLAINGDIEIQSVTGANVKAWSLQQPISVNAKEATPMKRLIITLLKPIEKGTAECTITATKQIEKLRARVSPLFFTPKAENFLSGGIKVLGSEDVRMTVVNAAGLEQLGEKNEDVLIYAVAAEAQSLALHVNHRANPVVTFNNFQLKGNYEAERFSFVLTGVLDASAEREYTLNLLSGAAALTAAPVVEGGEVILLDGKYALRLPGKGSYPVRLEFDAAVTTVKGLSQVKFDLLNAALQPVELSGMPVAKNRIQLNGAPLDGSGKTLRGSLNGDGLFYLSWNDPTWKSPAMGKAALFYSVENTTQVVVSSGLLWQNNDFNVNIMQGSMDRLVFDLEGEGEITRVTSEGVLKWEVVKKDGRSSLVLDLNRRYGGELVLRILSQQALQALPADAEPMRFIPRDAIHYAGFVRIVNKGAVSIDVPSSKGFAQISPEFFQATRDVIAGSGQQLTYRFSDASFSYTVRAEDILPDVSVSQILLYNVGSEDQSLIAEMELTIREAPLRDFFIRIPEGYALSNLKANSLADYFLVEDSGEGRQLRLVFGQPLSGRQVIRAEFEDNRKLQPGSWTLPVFEALNVKSARGHIGVSVEPGLRASIDSIDGLSEQAVNFFPKEVKQLQVALRMREEAWSAVLNIEQLPQAIQADALHLYSVAEGRIYGSSIINYFISGAPVSEFKIQVPEGMQNLDFAGRDVRGWSELDAGVYEVKLHTPASGAYTLLASYESQFAAEGAQVSFSGVMPQGVDSEEGYVVVVSNFPFAVGKVAANDGLLRLEPGEIPADFRLLYDAKELAAYQYTTRPVDLTLELSSYAQAQGTDQVIDFADLKSHISRDGEILTAVDIMLKSKGQTHFRMQLPPEHRIWSARVAGDKVSPIAVEGGILLPLPTGQDPNSAVRIQIELASQAQNAAKPVVFAPAMYAPSLLVNWELTSDPGFGLRYAGGDISSVQMSLPASGFAWFQSLIGGEPGFQRKAFLLMLVCGLLAVGLMKFLIRRLEQLSILKRAFLGLGVVAAVSGLIFCGLLMGWGGVVQQNLQDTLVLRSPIELSTQPLRLLVENQDYSNINKSLGSLWPFALGIGLWIYGMVKSERRELCLIAGWVVNFLAALNYSPSGALFLSFLILFFIIYTLRPIGRRYIQRAGGQVAVLAFCLLGGTLAPLGELEAVNIADMKFATVVNQDVRVEGRFAVVDAELMWTAEAGDQLPFLKKEAILIQADNLPKGLKLVGRSAADALSYRLDATEAGSYTVKFRYQVKLAVDPSGQSSFELMVINALSRQARIDIDATNIVLNSKSCVTVKSVESKEPRRSVYEVVFAPNMSATVEWSPKPRDISNETPVYHVQSYDVYTPLSGLISGYHHHKVRLAQGQLDNVKIDVPDGMTITAVEGTGLTQWQFDPEGRALLLYYQSAQTSAFELSIYSQYSSGELPYLRSVETLRVNGAASQLSMVALATDEEVQVGSVKTEDATVMNLEDFPADFTAKLSHLGRVPVLRRAFRWSENAGALELQALPVEADVRVTTKQKLSLGEDRILLSVELKAMINRAGLFRLSLSIPEDYDVESVSGQHLSHWNELTAKDGSRMLQLHLRGKTIGETALAISLSGAGLGDRSDFVPPILKLEETDRQSGTLVLVPELGYRLTTTDRKGALQLDPADAGMSRQKLMLFRILNENAALAFTVERVEPWIEVEKVQAVTVRSGMVDVKARFNFLVENAGIREQAFSVPENAIGVQFSGEAVTDHQKSADGTWLVKMNRKVVGAFTVELSYQMPTPDQPLSVEVQNAQAVGVDQESGYLVLIPQGRLQLAPADYGMALQNAEAQMISSKLSGDLSIKAASHVYRVLQPEHRLNVNVLRHEIAELVPAQVRDVELTSVISGKGAMLTKVTLKLDPGDKRMLRITLPEASEFWFGFVNQQSAWPWREAGDVLLQLEASAIEGEDSVVEFFYSTESVADDSRKLRASLHGPKLDLPLEHISWSIYYPETWEIEKWGGNMTQDRGEQWHSSYSDIKGYIQSEQESRKKQKVVAETLLNEANTLLGQGKQEQARQAFNSAYNLSQFDAALNEDARVQLKNVREEQALVALANRRNSFINDNGISQSGAVENQYVTIDDSKLLNYTDQTVKDVLGGNSEEENSTLRLLATRLIDQQQAVLGTPQAIQTLLPEQGKTVSFSRSLQINDRADLVIELKGKRSTPAGQAGIGIGMILLLLILVGGVSYLSKD